MIAYITATLIAGKSGRRIANPGFASWRDRVLLPPQTRYRLVGMGLSRFEDRVHDLPQAELIHS